MKKGSRLFSFAGTKVVVDSVFCFRTDTATTVYNLEVKGNENYYVSASRVLVHNKPMQIGKIKIVSKSTSPVWKKLNNFKGKIKTSGSGRNKRYFQWDHTHSDIEVYNHQGIHMGSMHPITGELYKPPVKGRKLKF